MEEDFLIIVGQELRKHFQSDVSVGIGSNGFGFTIKKTGTIILFTMDELLVSDTPEAAAEVLINQLIETMS
ncbi:hypothetical protein [Neobacillus soli]|uniref:hypothetical protein n=1 Tax=Neobacillus soli TaxID=220688 RepID=UPI0008247061|nr:hypothetical protein [Neobacillus soli]